ncbi:RNA polymerase sigma factor [Chitinophaga niastensis]|uniref:RNA polymerase sigma factor n=1 Tax=Chitinophaga niastensis TaxID=536980 RepID=UPI001304E922|nr:sigma-70 family RNA polymerase sigma factor [Chitinophaga niastensis]
MHKENIYNEQELLLLVANGDKNAYAQLFDHYWDHVYGTGLHLTKSPELSKDLAQDIFLKLWDARSKLSEIKNLSTYLYVLTKNLFHDHLRTNVFRESNKEFLINYFAHHETSPHKQLEQKELSGFLDEAINNLPPQLHQVFTLSRFEGLSHIEIGRKLNISPLSSKTYMTRALITLRKQIGENPWELLFIIGVALKFSIFNFFLDWMFSFLQFIRPCS